jgi:hypothetical protein
LYVGVLGVQQEQDGVANVFRHGLKGRSHASSLKGRHGTAFLLCGGWRDFLPA